MLRVNYCVYVLAFRAAYEFLHLKLVNLDCKFVSDWKKVVLERHHKMSSIQCGRNAIRQIVQGASVRSSDGAVHPLFHACQGVRYRKLEVILTTVRGLKCGVIAFSIGFLASIYELLLYFFQSIEKLGKAGETVKVAPGYFRNHLMPKLLAVPNIEKFAYLIREQRKVRSSYASEIDNFSWLQILMRTP